MKIGFLHEHPTWSDALIDCFAQNGIEPVLINIAETPFATDAPAFDVDLCVNRINIMPSHGRAPAVAAHTLHFLNWLEGSGTKVINGFQAHFAGASKAVQNGIFAGLDLDHPTAIAIYRPEDAPAAAERIGFPVIVKPNIGGSGSGIARFEDSDELQAAVENGDLDLGIDGTGLVQEYIQSDGFVYRVEVLGDELFYGIRQRIVENQFNYCAADGCSISLEGSPSEAEFDFCSLDSAGRIEPHEVPDGVLQNVLKICRAAGAEVGGVEYFIRAESGSACFYDFNPYSNFVGEGKALFGFSPEQRFVDFVKAHLSD
ncbi:hypothetical protein NBRC116590_33510 [Pelagimonas sp. KU-00592-HH]|uniref:ATP-grasp domain-containing protein n=1 Tax=Pelagimonas sp. KU-00592-HH TaxID=3127651 RepID=UPI003103499D